MKDKKTSKNEKGQSLVEMALSLVLLFTLLSGLVDLSFALFRYVAMRDAAQEGALYGSVSPGDTIGIERRAAAAAADIIHLNASLTNNDIIVQVNGNACEGLTSGAPNSITVGINFTHQLVFPFANLFTGPLQLHADVTDTILSPGPSDCP